MNINQGPEDSPGWSRLEENSLSNSIEHCKKCGLEIQDWHCDDLGCPWCAICGENSKEKK